MSSRIHVSQGGVAQPSSFSKLDEHRARDERTYLLRSSVLGALTVTAVLYGLAVYYGLSDAQQIYAGKEFELLAKQAGQDIRSSLTQSAHALSFLSERYATTFPDEAEWPTVMLPGFQKDMHYLRDISGFETLAFAPLVRFEDVNRTERFLMDAWAADPLIPDDAGLLPLPGIYGVNATAGRSYYKDTSSVDWDAEYDIVTPIAQLLFDRDLPAHMHGRDVHASSDFGPGLEAVMKCTLDSNYSHAMENCNLVKLGVSPLTVLPANTIESNFVVPIMLGQNSSRLVGFVIGYFQWGKAFTRLIPEYVSGIDIVMRAEGVAITFRLDKGQAVFHSVGDTHADRYAQFKYVMDDVLISGSHAFTLEFYPRQEFMDTRTDNSPIYLSVGTGLFLLLCTLLFFLYDVPMRNSAIRTEIVLETKRRFVRFISHEIRTPLNTVNMGLTLFDLELDCIRDAVERMVGQGQEQGQSDAQTALEVVQKFLLGKIDELKSIARDVTTSTDEAVDILTDVLAYEKIESGNFVLEFAFVSVGEVLQRTVDAFLLQAKDKNVTLTLSTTTEDEAHAEKSGSSSGEWASGAAIGNGTGAGSSAERLESGLGGLELDPRYQLIGDGSRLGQVVRNLLSNALKFTYAGGSVAVTVVFVPSGMPGKISIALPEEQRELLLYPRAGSVRISVVDSGAGLTEQQVLDIGQEGLHFNVSTQQGGGGSGLGLYITKGLVQQHGGQMTVVSAGLGKGVSIILEFPLFDAFDDPDEPDDPDEFPQPHTDTASTANHKQQEEHHPVGAWMSCSASAYSLSEADTAPRLSGVAGGGSPAVTIRQWEGGAVSGSVTIHSPDELTMDLHASRSPRPGLPPTTSSSPEVASVASRSRIRRHSDPHSGSNSPARVTVLRHMLVVDDAVSNRKLLMRIFRIKGFICEEACDGQDALHKYASMCAQGTPPEAILMDYEMPVLNGPSATRLLRQQGCMVFIIGVTGNVMRTDIDYFKSCGVDAVFTKPLSKESVDKLVARIALPRYDRGSSSKWSVASSSVSSHLSTPSQMANALHSQLLLASQPHHPAPTAPPPTRPRTAGE